MVVENTHTIRASVDGIFTYMKPIKWYIYLHEWLIFMGFMIHVGR